MQNNATCMDMINSYECVCISGFRSANTVGITIHQRIYVHISLVEGTAISHRLSIIWLTQPLPACSVGSYTDGQVVQYTADRAGRGWVSQYILCYTQLYSSCGWNNVDPVCCFLWTQPNNWTKHYSSWTLIGWKLSKESIGQCTRLTFLSLDMHLHLSNCIFIGQNNHLAGFWLLNPTVFLVLLHFWKHV